MTETLDRRIAQIEQELTGLRRQKLADLQSQMAALQSSIESGGMEALTRTSRRGRPPKSSSGLAGQIKHGIAAGTARKRRGRKRGKHVPDEDALAAIRK